MAVIFRDARNIVISEHRMRIEVYHQDIQDVGELEPFIHRRFEVSAPCFVSAYILSRTCLFRCPDNLFLVRLPSDK